MNDPNPTGLTVGQIYLATAHFDHRGDPLLRPANTHVGPQQINVTIGLNVLNDGAAYSVQAGVTTVESDENALYDFAVLVTGILEQGPATKRLTQREITEIGATMLFPFVREAVANLTLRGRFGPVWLNPFNVRGMLDAHGQAAVPEKENPTP